MYAPLQTHGNERRWRRGKESNYEREVINTTDVYYLGIVTNANGVAILGSTSTLTNNEPYVNGFIDNIVNFKIDDLKTLYSISSSETGYKVNSSSDAYYLRLLSNSNTNI